VKDLERKIIYLFVLLALLVPLITGLVLKPVKMDNAGSIYTQIEELKFKKNEVAFVALDFGPNTKGENEPQSEVFIEHLMLNKIPFVLFSQYFLAEPFLKEIPLRVSKKIMKLYPERKLEYGVDWVNLGYQPGRTQLIQSIPKSDDLRKIFIKDVRGNKLENLPIFKNLTNFSQIKLLAQFTGLTGLFDIYVSFFKNKEHQPLFFHGCTSITIPDAYIYLDSKQINGLFEGIAGAAWYSELLNIDNPGRVPDSSHIINTMLGVAHLVIILLIIFGNIFRRKL